MNKPGEQLASSISALSREYSTISHNIANVSTNGYKRKLNTFSLELLKRLNPRSVADAPKGEIKAKDLPDFSQGPLTKTDRSLDLAIEGKGFITIETPNGPLYSRNGVLEINKIGQLVDTQGRLVAGKNGPITIPADVPRSHISIGQDGVVTADGNEFGQLGIVEFGNDVTSLIRAGNGCFKAPQNVEPIEAAATSVRQGYREKSNVNIAEELIGLMKVARLYEANMSILRKKQENSQAMMSVANS